MRTPKDIYRLNDTDDCQPFQVNLIKQPFVDVNSNEGICFNKIFMKLDMSPDARDFIYRVSALINKYSGMLSINESETGKLIPLGAKQIATILNMPLSKTIKLLDEFVFYGVLAEVSVAGTSVFLANPYFVTRGFNCNAFLFNIFNDVTLRRIDKTNGNFKLSNRMMMQKFWEKGDLGNE